MSASVEKITQRKWQAYCAPCGDGVNVARQVDALIWASTHNREAHTA